MRQTEARSYMLYLFDDIVSTHEFAHGRRPDWEARLEAFAGRLVATAQAAEADEILVVGHSSGSFMAVDVLARALARDAALGRHGPRLSLLTLGANLPIVGFNPAGRWFHDKLRRVVAEPDLTWLDVQSRKDVMSFYPFDQAAGHGISVAKPNLRTHSVRFRDVLLPENYRRFRWRFFRVHFQYLMANERRAAYDYFMMICGPRLLAEVAGEMPRAGK
jgi:pimeloyl-ACP methyl ester carboxylesterase